MSAVIRHTHYKTTAEALSPDQKEGSECGLLSVAVTLPAIAQNASAVIFKLKGGGKLKEVVTLMIVELLNQKQLDLDGLSLNSDTGEITLSVPTSGTAIPLNSIAYMLLVVGG